MRSRDGVPGVQTPSRAACGRSSACPSAPAVEALNGRPRCSPMARCSRTRSSGASHPSERRLRDRHSTFQWSGPIWLRPARAGCVRARGRNSLTVVTTKAERAPSPSGSGDGPHRISLEVSRSRAPAPLGDPPRLGAGTAHLGRLRAAPPRRRALPRGGPARRWPARKSSASRAARALPSGKGSLVPFRGQSQVERTTSCTMLPSGRVARSGTVDAPAVHTAATSASGSPSTPPMRTRRSPGRSDVRSG